MNIVQKLRQSFSIEELKDTMKRFPLSAICTVCLFLYGTALIFEIHKPEHILELRLILSLIYGFIWCGCVQLFCEAKGLGVKKMLALSLGGLVFFNLFVFFGQGAEIATRLFAVMFALLAALSAAPFILRKSDDLSYWSFNRKMGFGIGIAFLAALILFGGLSAALASIGYLFEVDISPRLYSFLWLFGASLVAPLYALSFVPKTFDETPQDCTLPPQVGFLANWILAPLVVLYLAILYAYFIKIGVTQEVPKNQLSYMTIGFAAAAIATYQLAWPFVFDGKANALLRLLMKYLFPLLILPVLVMIYAIGIRIAEYGITEKRYIVLLAALWFVFLTVGFTLKKLNLKHIMLSLAVVLFFGSWGPWGMWAVSMNSQSSRLDALVAKHDLLDADGTLVKHPAPDDISLDDQKNISSIVQYIARRTKDEKRKDTLYGAASQTEFFEQTGLTYIGSYQIQQMERDQQDKRFRIHFKPDHRNIFDLDERGYFLSNFYVSSVHDHAKDKEFKLNEETVLLLQLEENILSLTIKGQETVKINLDDQVAKYAHAPNRLNHSQPPIIIRQRAGLWDITLTITNMNGIKDEADKPVLEGLNGRILILKR